MKVMDPGHCYKLLGLDGIALHMLTFVKRKGPNFPGNLDAHGGTTSQEVLRALIDRAIYVNAQIPCWQTKLSIRLMMRVVWLYEHRAAKRHGRKPPTVVEAVYGALCPKCGHVSHVCKEVA